IHDDEHPEGVLTGTLVPGAPDPDTQLLPFTVVLAASPRMSTDATATASFTLNVGRTGLTYTVRLQDAARGAGAALRTADGQSFPLPLTETTGTGTLSFQVTNPW